jgi:ankyrin repeat protein
MSSLVPTEVIGGKSPLLKLPNELLLEVAPYLDRFGDLNALLRTCCRFYTLLHIPLYRRAVTADATILNAIAEWVLAKCPDASLVHLLDNGFSANFKFINGSDLLYALCRYPRRRHSVQLARKLLERGADAEAKHWERGDTVLHTAVKNNCSEIVALLLEHGADANPANTNGTRPLHYAAIKGACHIAKMLLAHNADFDVVDFTGRTPLHHAVEHGNWGIATLLQAYSADVNVDVWNGNMPLHIAAMLGDPDVTALLLANGADVNAAASDGHTPLQIAAKTGDPDVTTVLLANGADVNAAAWDGRTPLHIATTWGNADVTAVLLANGADVNMAASDGRTPLHIGAAWGGLAVTALLLANGADVNAAASDGCTPLHIAATKGRTDVTALLLANGADVNARDRNGDTPSHNALRNGKADVIPLLLAHGADFTATDKQRKTPQGLFSNATVHRLVKSLLDRGSEVKAGSPNKVDETKGLLGRNIDRSKQAPPASQIVSVVELEARMSGIKLETPHASAEEGNASPVNQSTPSADNHEQGDSVGDGQNPGSAWNLM